MNPIGRIVEVVEAIGGKPEESPVDGRLADLTLRTTLALRESLQVHPGPEYVSEAGQAALYGGNVSYDGSNIVGLNVADATTAQYAETQPSPPVQGADIALKYVIQSPHVEQRPSQSEFDLAG